MLAMARAEWGMGQADTLWFLMGGDSLEDLPTWHTPAEILKLARLAVVDRPGHSSDTASLETILPGIGARVDHVVAPLVGVSGTDIRRRVAESRTIRWHVPPAVERHIHEHGLYRRVPTA
jgi:nicotinate-nucleotide adenylyltransferase